MKGEVLLPFALFIVFSVRGTFATLANSTCWRCRGICKSDGCSSCQTDAGAQAQFHCERASGLVAGTCVSQCDATCVSSPYSCDTVNNTCVSDCGESCQERTWHCPTQSKCVKDCSSECVDYPYPEAAEQKQYDTLVRNSTVGTKEYKRITALDGTCLSKSSYHKVQSKRCVNTVKTISGFLMNVQGCIKFTHLISMLVITNYPSKRVNYLHLVSPKVQDAAPIFGALTGSTIGILRSTYALALNQVCPVSQGRTWGNMHSWPTPQIMGAPGFIAGTSFGFIYLMASFLFTINSGKKKGKVVCRNVLNEFKNNVVINSKRSLICKRPASCYSDRKFDLGTDECWQSIEEKRKCLNVDNSKDGIIAMKAWKWKNLFYNGCRKNIITKSMKTLAVEGYLNTLRNYRSHFFMLSYEFTIIVFGITLAYTFFYGIQWKPSHLEVEGVSIILSMLWSACLLLVLHTYYQFLTLIDPKDGFEFACGGNGGDGSRDRTADCQLWEDCMSCDGLEDGHDAKCNEFHYHLSLSHMKEGRRAGEYDNDDIEEWIERTSTCWALTRQLKGLVRLDGPSTQRVYKVF